MRLLIYSHFFAPSIGGVETIVMTLARGLTQAPADESGARFDVTVATQTAAGDFDDGALPFRMVRHPGVFELLALVRRADVVHLAGPALFPLALGFVLRKPVVVEHHGYQAICPNGVLLERPNEMVCPGHFQARNYHKCLRCRACEIPWPDSVRSLVLTFLRRALCGHVAVNLAITKHVLVRHALPRSQVTYYGIEDPLSAGPRPGSQSRVAVSRQRQKVCFSYIGRLVPEKGVPVLVEAARRLHKEELLFEVVLIGDGPSRPAIEDLIRLEGLESCVRITGFLTGAALQETLSNVDVVVMPSVWEETAGLAAIEQMMRGRLVIASAIGGLGEVVSEAGLACTPGDPSALAACMRRVLADPSLIESIGHDARIRALHLFGRQRMIEEHARVYREVGFRLQKRPGHNNPDGVA